MAKAVQHEAERLGLGCVLGHTSKAQHATLTYRGQTRTVNFASTPSDRKATIWTLSLMRRLKREMEGASG